MMKQNKFLLLAFLSLFFNLINGQVWMDEAKAKADAENKELNYFDIVAEFEKFRDGRDYERGLGFKQFYRWKNFWRTRVNSDGTFPRLVENINIKRMLAPKTNFGSRAGTWTTMGPDDAVYTSSWSPGHGRVNGVAVDPNNANIIYVGAPSGGVWKSTDGGNNWTPLGDQLALIGVSSIAIDPNNSNTIYLGTGDADGFNTYGIGVLKSTDGGNTWNEVLPTPSASTVVPKVLIDPSNSNHIFAATSSGFYRSSDAGATWTETNLIHFRDFEFHPTNSNVIYAVSSNKAYKSSDNGVTWSTLSTGAAISTARQRVEVSAAAPNEVWILSCTSSYAFDKIIHSTDQGGSWTDLGITDDIFDGSTQAWYDLSFSVSPNNEDIMFVGVLNVWKSSNGGASWGAINSWNNPNGAAYTHADIHYTQYFNNDLYAATDGGIYKSTNDGASFSDLTRGLNIGQFYKIDVISGRNQIVGGLQDNGGYFYNGNEWRIYHGADGMDNALDPTDPSVAYGMIQYGGLYKTTNNGLNNISLGQPNDGSGEIDGNWVTPMMFDPSNDDVIIAGYDKMYAFNTLTNIFTPLSDLTFTGLVDFFDISTINPNIILVSNGNSIYKSTDKGVSYDTIGNPTGNFITSVVCSPINENDIWVTCGGNNAGNKVFYSNDGGSTWQNMSTGIPNITVNHILIQPGTSNMAYVATDIGVYYKDNSMAAFEAFNDGLPNVIIRDLELDLTNSVLYAGTYGRGVWKSPTPVTSSTNPLPSFQSTASAICPGESITYYNTSVQSNSVVWTFTGGDITTSTEDTVTVTYANAGNYSVSLEATLGGNSETLTETDYANVLSSSNGANIPFSENFENTTNFNNNWSIKNYGNNNAFFLNAIGFQSQRGITLLNKNQLLGTLDEIISIPFDFSTATTASIGLKVSYAQRSFANNDSLKIFLQEVCNPNNRMLVAQYGREDLQVAWEIGIWQPSSDADWKNFNPGIPSEFLNNSYQVVIQFKAGGGNHVYIDDINIDLSTGVNEQSITTYTVFPNPIQNTCTINIANDHQIYQLDLIDLTGKLVKKYAFTPSSEVNLELSDLKAGVYLFMATTTEGIQIKGKIEKE